MTTNEVFKELETGDLKLIRLTDERAPEIFSLRTNEKAMKYIGRPAPASMQDVYDFIKTFEDDLQNNRSIVWGILHTPTNELAGTIGYHRMQPQNFRAEIGYMLFPKFWGKGVMSRCIKLVLEFGFNEMELHSVEAHISPDNEASRQVLKKFGFVSEAYFRENFFFNGKFLDSEVFSLLKSQYYK